MVAGTKFYIPRWSAQQVEANWGKLSGGYIMGTPVVNDDLVVWGKDGYPYNIGPVTSLVGVDFNDRVFYVRTANTPESQNLLVFVPDGVNLGSLK